MGAIRWMGGWTGEVLMSGEGGKRDGGEERGDGCDGRGLISTK